MRLGELKFVLLASAGVMTLSGQAFAQTQEAADRNEKTSPDTVVVTGVTGFVAAGGDSATKTSASLMEIPRSVSVVTAEEIANRGADTLNQVLQYTPGFSGDSYGANSLSRSFSNVRGFLSFQYLDGLKLHDSNWGIEPYGLDRAELFKGPGSALYGQASPGGVIALVSKRPTEESVREIALQGGSDNRKQVAFDFGGKIDADGKFLYRLTALGRDAETPVRFQKDDRYYVAPAFAWRPSDRTEVTVLTSWQSDPNLTVFQYLPRVGTIAPSAFGYVPRETFTGQPGFDDLHIERTQAAVLVDHAFSDTVSIHESVRHTHLDIVARYLQAGAVQANQRIVPRTAVNSEFDIDLTQSDTHLKARFDTLGLSHTILAGLDYVFIPTYQGVGQAASPTLDLYAPTYTATVALPAITSKRDQDFEQLGLYLQDQIEIERLTILLGLRRDNAKSETSTLNTVTGVRSATVKQDDDATTGQIGAIFQLDHGIAPYVSYAKSFQPTPGTDFFGNAFVPSTGEQGEIGVKYQPSGFNALFTAAAFELVQQNVRTNDLAHPGFAIQTGEVRSRGFEIEGKVSLMPDLNVSASYMELDNVVTKSTTATLGKRPQGRPEQQASIWADYTLPFAPLLTVGGGVRYVGESFGDANNTFVVPDYTLFDGLIRFDLSQLGPVLEGTDLSINAQNIANLRYVANCDAATQCFYGPGQVIKATLRRQW